ncbi:MAG: MerR family transcriptional regulator [Candidatus Korobacteraceae bacterium]
MNVGATKLYWAREFAELAGVTVRTLHHYDRLGLLKPSHRSDAGYRLYSQRDLAQLEQIVVLKFLGLPLKSIGKLLRSAPCSLPEVLERQHLVLSDKRHELDRTIEAIGAARAALDADHEPDWTLITQIIRRVGMQNDTDWTSKYYSEDAKGKIEERKGLWSPEMQERVTREWNELFRDVEAALGEDPASPAAQALAGRWRKLVGQFTGGNPEIQKGLNAMYADTPNWPPEKRQQHQVKSEIQEFIMQAMQAAPKG